MTFNSKALKLHQKLQGKISTTPKTQIKDKNDLSLIYTPGVAEVSRYLSINKKQTARFTIKGNTIAVVSDGSAVLGLGNIGPQAALPVMEGKCLLFKHFGNINAFPIVLSTQDPDLIIKIVKAITPTFGGINLEDISAPNCFYIEETLKKELDIPVLHDDQWGAAVVVLAGLINSLKLVKKEIEKARIVISGAGAAGTATAKILFKFGAKNILVCDSQGIIFNGRQKMNCYKQKLAQFTNPDNEKGDLAKAMKTADVFVGLSAPGLVSPKMVSSMNNKPIIFALANPIPEIMPSLAKKAGAYIVATGRSDYPNQVNNVLAFPGIFKGALGNKVKTITLSMLIKAAKNLASLVKNPSQDNIIPSPFNKKVVLAVSQAIC